MALSIYTRKNAVDSGITLIIINILTPMNFNMKWGLLGIPG